VALRATRVSLVEALALNDFAYNFIKIHSTLRVTPAMAAGVTNRLFDVSDLVALLVETEKKSRGACRLSGLRSDDGPQALPADHDERADDDEEWNRRVVQSVSCRGECDRD
jgi:hypothetical protein